MSLATSSAFQLAPYTQARAFVVVGSLSSVSVDDDLLYQILVAFRLALTNARENNMLVVISMIRCIHKLASGLPQESRGLPSLVWLAIALIQSSFSSLYAESARLLQQALEILYRDGPYSKLDIVSVFRNTRYSLENISSQIDRVVGLSFETDFSMALATTVFKGLRYPPTSAAAKELLYTLLRIGTSSLAIDESTTFQPVSSTVIGYFLALLPVCTTRRSFAELVLLGGATPDWLELMDSELDEHFRIPFGIFGVRDNNTALLVITFIIGMLNSADSEMEKEIMFALLADASVEFPGVIAIACVDHSLIGMPVTD